MLATSARSIQWLSRSQVSLTEPCFRATLPTAHGLASCIMEGFDSRRVKRALRVPGGFSVPLMVCVGYPAHPAAAVPLSARYPAQDVFYRGTFGTPFAA
jgi:hypothetical protein